MSAPRSKPLAIPYTRANARFLLVPTEDRENESNGIQFRLDRCSVTSPKKSLDILGKLYYKK